MGMGGGVGGQSISFGEVVCSNEKQKAARYINLQHVRGRPVSPALVAWLRLLVFVKGSKGVQVICFCKRGIQEFWMDGTSRS